MNAFNPQQFPEVNKLKRYKIGFVFFIVYIILSQGSTIIIKYSKTEPNPFFQSYLQISFLSLLLLSSFLMNRCMSKKSREILDIFRYFIPEWKNEEKGKDYIALSSSFIIYENTEEKFYKEVHKIGFFLMVLLFFSLSLMKKAQSSTGEVLIPLSFYIGSVIVIMFLRIFLLHLQKLNWLSMIAFSVVILGVGFLFSYELKMYLRNDIINIAKVYICSSIGGIFFGFFSIFLKYYYNQYCNYFQFSLIFGYIGLYCLITIPCFLCLVAMFGSEIDMTVTVNPVWKYICYCVIELLKIMSLSYCVLSLSPLVFNFGCFVNVGINMAIYIIIGSLEFNYLFIIGIILLLTAMILCVVDKYKKNAEKEKKRLSEKAIKIDKANADFNKILQKEKVDLEPIIKPNDNLIYNEA